MKYLSILFFLPGIWGRRLCRCNDLKDLFTESNCCSASSADVLDTQIADCIFPHHQLPATCGSIQAVFNSPQQNCCVIVDNFINWYRDDEPECYIFRVQEAWWDHGGDVGERAALLFHQYVHATTGARLTPGNPLGQWEPFLPGPTIRGRVGDTVCVTIQNRIDLSTNFTIDSAVDSTIIHWHGIELANAYDGTPVTQRPIATGEDFTYRFVLTRAQVAWYHSHWDSLIQNQLGLYGVIVVDDDIVDSLRASLQIPEENRTFVISLTDTSFQTGRSDPNNLVPIEDFPNSDQLWTRDITNTFSGDQNFGNVFLINGMHEIAFNNPFANHQQFWDGGNRTSHTPVVLKPKETVVVHIANNGIFRAYKIGLQWTNECDYQCRGQKVSQKFQPVTAIAARSMNASQLKTSWVNQTMLDSSIIHNGFSIEDFDCFPIFCFEWTRSSESLYVIGGEGGLLNQARTATGTFTDGVNPGWFQRSTKGRDNPGAPEGGMGKQTLQNVSELEEGELLLMASMRTTVAFQVPENAKNIRLVTNGWGVHGEGVDAASDKDDPTNLVIATWSVEGPEDPDPFNIQHGTPLRTAVTDPHPWLGDMPAVTELSEADAQIIRANAVAASSFGPDMYFCGGYPPSISQIQSYEVLLNGGGGNPAMNGESVHHDSSGNSQCLWNNTKFVKAGDVVEWTVETETTNADHPFHLHGFSFQPIKMELNNGTGYQTLYEWNETNAEYMDVFFVPSFHRLTFRFLVEDRSFVNSDLNIQPNGVYGRWLDHCHISKHAHRGMMQEFVVLNGDLKVEDRVDIPQFIVLPFWPYDFGKLPAASFLPSEDIMNFVNETFPFIDKEDVNWNSTTMFLRGVQGITVYPACPDNTCPNTMVCSCYGKHCYQQMPVPSENCIIERPPNVQMGKILTKLEMETRDGGGSGSGGGLN